MGVGQPRCNGNSGTFTAKAMAKASNSQRAVTSGIESGREAISTRSKVRSPPVPRADSTAVATVPTNMNAEPNIV